MAKPEITKYGNSNVFSRIHRRLGSHAYLTDIDYLDGTLRIGAVSVNVANCGEGSLFAEYQVDGTNAATTAIFDYKHSQTDWVLHEINNMRVGTSLWYYKQLAKQLHARFFVVCGSDGELPLHFFELTDGTAEVSGTLYSSEPSDVQDFWRDVLHL